MPSCKEVACNGHVPEDTDKAVVEVHKPEIGGWDPEVEQVDDELEAGCLACPVHVMSQVRVQTDSGD